jgi:hypothetical protein
VNNVDSDEHSANNVSSVGGCSERNFGLAVVPKVWSAPPLSGGGGGARGV